MAAFIKGKIEQYIKPNSNKIAVIAFLLSALLLYLLASNVAYAVSINGEFVGYASTVDEITSAMDSVAATASGALGYEYSLESNVAYELTIGSPDESIGEAVEEILLDDIDSIGKYAVVCVNGEPFCAFESTEAATSALSAYTALYTSEDTVSANFLETVSIKVDYADKQLLDAAGDFNTEAAGVLNVESVDIVTEESVIPYETEYVMDDTILSGDTYVAKEGVNGVSRICREFNNLNGEHLSSTILENTILSSPENAVVHMGTRERLSTGSYIWPTEGLLTSYYGYRRISVGSSNHQGLDIASDHGTEIYAADGGTVIFAKKYGGFGLLMKIEHDNGDVTYYAHCSKLLKKVGDTVSQGELIAYMGATGVVTGVHLHFEYHPGGGAAADPLEILP